MQLASLQVCTESSAAIEPLAESTATRRATTSSARLPSSLEQATTLLRQSELARTILGEPFVDHYVRTREWEVRQHAKAVSDWELRRYFESV